MEIMAGITLTWAITLKAIRIMTILRVIMRMSKLTVPSTRLIELPHGTVALMILEPRLGPSRLATVSHLEGNTISSQMTAGWCLGCSLLGARSCSLPLPLPLGSSLPVSRPQKPPFGKLTPI